MKILNDVEIETSPTKSKKALDFLTNLQIMAKSDYIICKFTHSFCRLSYELMQWNAQNDRSKSFRAMDSPYKFNFDSKFYNAVIRDQMIADQINNDTISKDFEVQLEYSD